jgi:predicted transcriptional regulator
MTLSIDIDEELRIRLEREARRLGVDPSAYARQLLERGLSSHDAASSNRATLDLLEQWDREDQTDDPAEIARRQQDLDELKRGLNDNRPSGRKPFP